MSSRITEATWIWKDGHLVLWKDGTVHLLSTAVQLFSSIFEGMRRHETPGGRAIFRLLQHLDCLMDPPTIYRMRPDATGCDRMRPDATGADGGEAHGRVPGTDPGQRARDLLLPAHDPARVTGRGAAHGGLAHRVVPVRLALGHQPGGRGAGEGGGCRQVVVGPGGAQDLPVATRATGHCNAASS
jgi:hypothetical protein